MKSIFISLAFIFIFTVKNYSPPTSIQQEKINGSFLSKLNYTYIEVFEKGEWWVYVYDGSELIDRYLLED